MSSEQQIQNSDPAKHTDKRPELLTVLCILTFIGSGSSMIANGILFLTIDPIKQLIEQQEIYTFLGNEINMGFLLDISPVFFLLQSLTLLGSFYGATLMWKLNKTGFHLYTISQIVLLILPKLFINGLPFPMLELLVSAIFIYLYAKSLSILK